MRLFYFFCWLLEPDWLRRKQDALAASARRLLQEAGYAAPRLDG